MKLLKALVIGGALALSAAPALAQQKGGIINVATVGEPPTLDPMVSTADLVGIITQHFFETLFTFDKNWKVTPLLAESLPEISADGKIYTIKLRAGRHLPRRLDDDLRGRRRLAEALDGARLARQADGGQRSTGVEAVDPATVRITPEGALRAAAGAARLQQRRRRHHAGGEDGEPAEGAGRHRSLQAQGAQARPVYPARPLRRLQVPRRRAATAMAARASSILDEIRFVPVPDPNTRIEGAVSGQYDYVDALPVEAFDRLKGQKTTQPVLLKPFGWPVFVMNTKQGVMANLDARTAVRRR